jgi:hypothetical protein
MIEVKLNIEDIQKAQAANLRAIALLEPESTMGRMVQELLPDLHRYVVTITHVWIYRGGALRAAHRMSIVEKGAGTARGSIFIDPTAVNPRGQRSSEYGVYEHARGGSHAFYERTMNERGPAVQGRAMQFIQKEIGGDN